MFQIFNAALEHLDAVFKLSNDPQVRSVSLSSKSIPYENHCEWYKKIITDPDILFLVFYDQENLVAQVRFKKKSKNIAEISISISEDYRGKGFGKYIIEESFKRLKNRWKINKIEAVVKISNEQSKKYFIKCGFVIDSTQKINNTEYILLFLNI